jgi:5-methylcytosine-specific restriction endonuclease McrA
VTPNREEFAVDDSGAFLFREEKTDEIASHFDVPISTAREWNSKLGDLKTLTGTLGVNAPDRDRYLHLLRQRERLPFKKQALLKHRVIPAHKWFGEKAAGFTVEASGGKLYVEDTEGTWHYEYNPASRTTFSRYLFDYRDDSPYHREYPENRISFLTRLKQIDGIVRDAVRRSDPNWITLAREEYAIRQDLTSLYRDAAGHPEEVDTAKELLKRLKNDFPYLRLHDSLTAHVADCSLSYTQRITYVPERGAESRRAPPALRREVHERDNYECVVCGADGTFIHHIIPHSQGGPHEKSNLATLCEEHHQYAHGRGKRLTDSSYNTVEYDSRNEFWNDWINRDFDDHELRQPHTSEKTEASDPGEQSTITDF